MPIFNTEEGKKKKTFKELMLEPSGLIQDVKGTRPFRFPNTIGDYISEEEAGRIKEGFKPAETFKDTINYPYGGERTARIAAQYRPQDNIISRIKETPPTVKFPDVWRGSIYTPGTVSTPEEQAFYERQSRQTLGGAITKSEPVYNNEGKIVGREEVPDIGAQHKALYETPEKQAAIADKQEMLDSYRQAGLDLKERGIENRERMNEAILNIREKALSFAQNNKNQLTIGDVNSSERAGLDSIKNEIMVLSMADKSDTELLSIQPATNLASLLMSGSIRSLTPKQKEDFIRRIKLNGEYYGILRNQVLGRKGAILPLNEEKPKRPRPVF